MWTRNEQDIHVQAGAALALLEPYFTFPPEFIENFNFHWSFPRYIPFSLQPRFAVQVENNGAEIGKRDRVKFLRCDLSFGDKEISIDCMYDAFQKRGLQDLQQGLLIFFILYFA